MWKCHKCGKPVFFAERKQSLGYDWHPECLRCEECGKRLNPGQHAEHKGVPYCHVPCYGALFGPQLFGHGTRVESHKSFGQKGSSPKALHLEAKQIESKVKEYNQYFDGKSGEIRSREVNGRLILEGSLRIYWGVHGVIHLKENDDQRTVVVRKRNSCRVESDFESDEDEDFIRRYHDEHMQDNNSFDTNPTDEISIISNISSDVSLDDRTDTGIESGTDTPSTISNSNSMAEIDSPVNGASEVKCLTLPGKLQDVKQMEWDELDELLQVERKVDECDKLYQTMPAPLPSQSSTESASDSSSTEKNCEVPTEVSCISETLKETHVCNDDETTETDVAKCDVTSPEVSDSWYSGATCSGNHLNRSMSGPDCLQRNSAHINTNSSSTLNSDQRALMEGSTTSCDMSTSVELEMDEEVVLRPKKTGSTAIKRRPGKRLSRSKIKRRCSINGHFYDRETSFFTPPHGSQMSVWVSSLVNTQEVINLMLEKYKVDSDPRNFALFVVRDNGEQKRLKDDDYPLMTRVMLGPHEDVSRLFVMDGTNTKDVSNEVAQFLNLSVAECKAILNQYCFQEEKEITKIQDKYTELRRRIQERLEEGISLT